LLVNVVLIVNTRLSRIGFIQPFEYLFHNK